MPFANYFVSLIRSDQLHAGDIASTWFKSSPGKAAVGISLCHEAA